MKEELETKDVGSKRPPCVRKKRETAMIGIGGWSSGLISHLGGGGPTYKTLKKTVDLEFVKRTNGLSSGLWIVRNRNLWRCRRPPKRRKKLQIEQERVM
jgi:hypothetical protein